MAAVRVRVSRQRDSMSALNVGEVLQKRRRRSWQRHAGTAHNACSLSVASLSTQRGAVYFCQCTRVI